MKLYTVTAFTGHIRGDEIWGNPDPIPTKDKYIACIASNIQTAREVVETNKWDIHEGAYKYAIIEEMHSDAMYGGDMEIIAWYEWHDQRYVEINIPNEYRKIVGWWL